MIILIIGKTGAGKTTYGQKLSKKIKGQLFSIDNWMTGLYWQDMPENVDIKWFQENQLWYHQRIQRCEDLMTAVIKNLASVGVPCLLDLGFTNSKHRLKYIEMANNLKCKIEIHHLEAGDNERWQRVQRRNQEKGSTYTMHVSKEMIAAMDPIFEPPQDQEIPYLQSPQL